MKKFVAGALLLGTAFTGNPAFADKLDDITARLDALERENSAIRKENAALRENKALRSQNAALKSDIVVQPARPASAATTPAPVASIKPSVFEAMAADLPVAYKASPLNTPGQFRAWVEGGAIMSGGDPVTQIANLTDFSGFGGLGGLGGGGIGGTIPRTFDLTPKIGWEAATGFDYRFAGSPWHVSGQFRYGEGGKTGGSASIAGMVDPALLALLGGGGGGAAGIASAGGSETFSTGYKETHWVADLAVGRDLIGSGRDAMQIKGGVRMAQFVTTTGTNDNSNSFFNFAAPAVAFPGFPAVTSVSITTNTLTDTRASFLGAGPLIGLEGSVPFAGNWSFDYQGDAAILFGTQQSRTVTTTTNGISPSFLNFLGGGGGNATIATAERFASAFSGDIQVGVGYWFTPNVKLAASYRLDALINVQNQDATAVTNITPDRYTHGPRLTLTGRF